MKGLFRKEKKVTYKTIRQKIKDYNKKEYEEYKKVLRDCTIHNTRFGDIFRSYFSHGIRRKSIRDPKTNVETSEFRELKQELDQLMVEMTEEFIISN